MTHTMRATASPKVESDNLGEFAELIEADFARQSEQPLPSGCAEQSNLAQLSNLARQCSFADHRVDLDPDRVKNGLGQLVLTLVKLLHELLERQAIRRIDAGSLSEAEIERLGLTLLKQTQEIDRLRRGFGLDEEDLNLDLGPLGRLF